MAWLAIAVTFALCHRSAEAGCGDHVRVIVGDVLGVQSLDIPPEPTPPARCSGPRCSRMPAFPISMPPPTGRFLEAWAVAPEDVVTGPRPPSPAAVPEPAVLPARRQSDHFRPPH